MERQCFGPIPGTTRVGWFYRDEGRMSAGIGKSRPVVQTFVPGGVTIAANVKANGGAKTMRLGGAA